MKKKIANNKRFWFFVGSTAFVFVYILAITFFPIREENARYIDLSAGFFMRNIVGTIIAYFTGKTNSDDNQTVESEN